MDKGVEHAFRNSRDAGLTDRGRRGGPRTLRSQVTRMVVTGLALELVLVVLTLVGLELSQRAGTDAGADQTSASRAAQLLIALEDQEDATRNYVATAQPANLALYTSSLAQAQDALDALDAETAGSPQASSVAELRKDVLAWEAWAEGMRQRVSASGAMQSAIYPAQGARVFEEARDQAISLLKTMNELALRSGERAKLLGFISLPTTVLCLVGGSGVLAAVAVRVLRLGLGPLLTLAETTERFASEGTMTTIPYQDRTDEVGKLASALRAWQDASAERALVTEQAPVGIARTDAEWRLVSVNQALMSMTGFSAETVLGSSILDFVHPADRARDEEALRQMQSGEKDYHASEIRGLQADGSWRWFAATVGPLRRPDGTSSGFVAIMDDITERKKQSERAARIQQELLPQTVPTLEGYELAGAMVPAEEVGGDFFDWRVTEDGQLDLTVADVMGKGIAAALMMATVRAALRAASQHLGPAERIQIAADSMTLDTDETGLFVTLFHARLDPKTGILRYVDAGHGHCRIRRSDGTLVALPVHSLPLGVLTSERFQEGQVTLRAGDMLVVHSDGLVETGDQTLDLRAFAGEMEQATDADDLVRRLVHEASKGQYDDVTVVVLRRLLDPAPWPERLEAAVPLTV
jgi:PAS domain S-box-containing protein